MAQADDVIISAGEHEVRLTSPDRMMWPDAQITKGDLAAYVAAVGEAIVPALRDRPVTLQRFPGGIDGEEFYQKNPPKGMPSWIETVLCRYPSGRRHLQVVINDVDSAIWAVQMNTITFHPWPVRTADTDRPDEVRIDLDPQPGRTFGDAVEAAITLREVLADVGLHGWVKTSGNRGVHVFAPIEATHEFLDVRHAVIAIARELERRIPDLVTTSWWKEERGKRVFVDFNQACRDRTLASAYSPRPLPGAPVSMPVGWGELGAIDPASFTVLSVPEIIADRGDAWIDMRSKVGRIDAALALWEADLERGLGELNFPPDYPKMPGEPPRVQPSKRRKDRSDEDYLAPKADRDAQHRDQWRMPVVPPISPMLAKPSKTLPEGEVSYEPKWDGFRSLIFRSGDLVEIGSRNEKPMTRYFPELVEAIKVNFPARCVIDGEIIVIRPGANRLDFDLLQQRIHPAASRVNTLAAQTPASFVGFDLLALEDRDLMAEPFSVRRALLEETLTRARAPIHLTPATRDPVVARAWFEQFEGAGLDGLIIKALGGTYEPTKRTMAKLKHDRTADCVVAGYRTHKTGDDLVGSLLLGLFTDAGDLANVGVIGAFPMARRRELFTQLQPLVADWEDHPWTWARQLDGERTPRHAEFSRWSAGKDLSFTPLEPTRVVEVRYDHMEGNRFRHTAQFVRWRPDREAGSCTYAQLEEPVSYDLADVLDA